MSITIDGTTGVSGVSGSAAAPAVQGDDTNTGVFFPAPDVVAVATGGVERLRVDSAGRILQPYQPAFYITTGALTGAINTTITITTGNVYANVGGHYSTATGRFTAPVTGVYTFTFWIARSNQVGSSPQFDINLNGVSTSRSLCYTEAYSGASVTAILSMAAGDYVNAVVIGTNSATPDIYSSGFSGHLIG